MARQAGPLFITGTVDDMVFYQMNGQYYMRLKGEPTPITKKRMSQKEHYPVLYLRKQEFKAASKMVRKWYYTLPREVRKHGLFGTLTGKAVRMFRKGMTEATIKALLLQELGQVEVLVEPPVATKPVEPAEVVKAIAERSLSRCPQKQKRAAKSKLSSWQVSERGHLQKEGTKQKEAVINEEGGTSLYASKGYYSTSTFSGWQLSVTDSCG